MKKQYPILIILVTLFAFLGSIQAQSPTCTSSHPADFTIEINSCDVVLTPTNTDVNTVELWNKGEGVCDWNVASSCTNEFGQLVHTYAEPGDYVVEHQIAGVGSCSRTVSIPIEAFVVKLVSIPEEEYLCPDETYQVRFSIRLTEGLQNSQTINVVPVIPDCFELTADSDFTGEFDLAAGSFTSSGTTIQYYDMVLRAKSDCSNFCDLQDVELKVLADCTILDGPWIFSTENNGCADIEHAGFKFPLSYVSFDNFTADFTNESDQYCTGSHLFESLIEPSTCEVMHRWFVNDILVSSTPNLYYNFLDCGEQSIRHEVSSVKCNYDWNDVSEATIDVSDQVSLLSIDYVKEIKCGEACVDLYGMSEETSCNEMVTYNWSLNGTTISNTADVQNICLTEPGNYIFTFTITNACGSNSENISVDVSADDIGFDIEIIAPGETLFFQDLIESGVLGNGGESGENILIDCTLSLGGDPETEDITNFTFNNCNITMAPGAKMIVEGGNYLRYRNSNVSGCDYVWHGIEILDKGKLLIYANSVMEDAFILAHGIGAAEIDIVGSTLNKNFIGVYTKPEDSPGDPGSSIRLRNSTIDCTSGILPRYPELTPLFIGANYPAVPSFSEGVQGYAGIFLQDHYQLCSIDPFGGTNYIRNLSNGILVKDVDLSVRRTVFENIQPYSFNNYPIPNGIAIGAQGFNGVRQLTVEGLGQFANPNFINCKIGVYGYKVNVPSPGITQNRMDNVRTGVRLNNPIGSNFIGHN